jgi:hypothetical protein
VEGVVSYLRDLYARIWDGTNTASVSAGGAVNVAANGYRSSDTSWQPLRLDKATNTIQVIDYEHHEIHAGSHYFITGFEDAIPQNDVLDFTFQTANTTSWVHFVWEILSEGETAWYVYENVIATNALANAVTPRNSNRNSGNTSGVTCKYEVQADLAAADADTNVTAPAILLKSGLIGDGLTGGSESRETELILKQNTIYCFRAVKVAAGYLSFDMQWYEHTDIA